jgi:hypothetical protein
MMRMDEAWNDKAKGMLRAEMTRRGISYKDMAERLAALGIEEKEANLRNKVSRGGFSAAFFVACLSAIGCATLRIED